MRTSVVLAWILMTASAWAQPEPSVDRERAAEQASVRYQVAIMERVLEQAVQHGASTLGRQLQAVAPDLVLFAGPARARGFRLDGYGYFFAVDVPALRQSVSWTFRALQQPDPLLVRALQSLKQHVQTIPDASARASLEAALKRVEGQVGPVLELPGTAEGSGPAPATVSTLAAGDSAVADLDLLEDPATRYTTEVRRALIDAMLDHSRPLPIGPDEWLTVAARDNDGRLSPGEIYEASTLILRIRGSELADFRADRLTREEARKRVDARDF